MIAVGDGMHLTLVISVDKVLFEALYAPIFEHPPHSAKGILQSNAVAFSRQEVFIGARNAPISVDCMHFAVLGCVLLASAFVVPLSFLT